MVLIIQTLMSQVPVPALASLPPWRLLPDSDSVCCVARWVILLQKGSGSNKIHLRSLCGIYKHAVVRDGSANRLILWDAFMCGVYWRDTQRLPLNDRSNLRQLVSGRRVSHQIVISDFFLSGKHMDYCFKTYKGFVCVLLCWSLYIYMIMYVIFLYM